MGSIFRMLFEIKHMNLWKEVVKITKACNHRFNTDSDIKINEFCRTDA